MKRWCLFTLLTIFCLPCFSFAFPFFSSFGSNNLPASANYGNISRLAERQGLSPQVLQLALKAYDHTKAEGRAQKPMLTIVDYSRPSSQPRLWVIDLDRQTVLFHLLVAHGKNSGDLVASRFSDNAGSLQSSIGVFVTSQPYIGKHGYSLHLIGLEKGFNTNARSREIVVHPAQYVSEQFVHRFGRLGRSWGCFAINSEVANKVINTIKGGSVVFAYYPHSQWLRHSRYLWG